MFAVLVLLITPFFAAALFALARLEIAVARVFVAFIAGLLTDFTIRAGIRFGADAIWASEHPPKPIVYVYDSLEWIYRELFGLGTFIARLFSPGYIPGSDLILPEDEAGAAVAGWLPIVVWSSLFAAIYFLRIRPRERSNHPMERTPGSFGSSI